MTPYEVQCLLAAWQQILDAYAASTARALAVMRATHVQIHLAVLAQQVDRLSTAEIQARLAALGEILQG